MGHHNIRFDGDTYSMNGAWSPSTSRANFCEEDYAQTFYLAEFINSLTNIAYVYLALRYMYGSGRGIFGSRVDFMSISLFGLGIASFLFHASLHQVLEFADEFSMLGLTWAMLQTTLTIRQSRSTARFISTGLTTVYTSFGAFYIRSPHIIYQVFAFAAALLVIVLRSQYLFHWLQPAFPRVKTRDWNKRTWKAICICLFAYFLWNIDLEYCTELRNIRHRIGLPWAWLFELHGWWHVLTAIGTSQFMNVAKEVREEALR